MRILVVEDDPLLADALQQLLRVRGMVVDRVGSADHALTALATENFDGVVLDIGLPGMDGFEMLRRLRARGSAVPVLVLTARDALADKVHGLTLGADDYLAKPFANEELVARLLALGRRARAATAPDKRLGRLRVDVAASRAWIGEQPLELPAREWAVLNALLDHAGHVLSKERLAALVSGWDGELSANAIETYVSRLRAKLEPAGLTLRSIRGFGYLLGES